MFKKSNLSASNLNYHNMSNSDNSGSPNIKQFVESQQSFIHNLNSESGSVHPSQIGGGSVSGSVHPSQVGGGSVSGAETLPPELHEQTGGVDDENNFLLYQEQLKNDVKEYLELDDQIKSLNKAVAQRRKAKSKLADSILLTMKKFEIENMNTKNGRLVYSVKKSFKGLNKKNLLSGLSIYFKDEEKAKDASTVVMSNREVIEKVSLKRSNNKKNPLNI